MPRNKRSPRQPRTAGRVPYGSTPPYTPSPGPVHPGALPYDGPSIFEQIKGAVQGGPGTPGDLYEMYSEPSTTEGYERIFVGRRGSDIEKEGLILELGRTGIQTPLGESLAMRLPSSITRENVMPITGFVQSIISKYQEPGSRKTLYRSREEEVSPIQHVKELILSSLDLPSGAARREPSKAFNAFLMGGRVTKEGTQMPPAGVLQVGTTQAESQYWRAFSRLPVIFGSDVTGEAPGAAAVLSARQQMRYRAENTSDTLMGRLAKLGFGPTEKGSLVYEPQAEGVSRTESGGRAWSTMWDIGVIGKNAPMMRREPSEALGVENGLLRRLSQGEPGYEIAGALRPGETRPRAGPTVQTVFTGGAPGLGTGAADILRTGNVEPQAIGYRTQGLFRLASPEDTEKFVTGLIDKSMSIDLEQGVLGRRIGPGATQTLARITTGRGMDLITNQQLEGDEGVPYRTSNRLPSTFLDAVLSLPKWLDPEGGRGTRVSRGMVDIEQTYGSNIASVLPRGMRVQYNPNISAPTMAFGGNVITEEGAGTPEKSGIKVSGTNIDQELTVEGRRIGMVVAGADVKNPAAVLSKAFSSTEFSGANVGRQFDVLQSYGGEKFANQVRQAFKGGGPIDYDVVSKIAREAGVFKSPGKGISFLADVWNKQFYQADAQKNAENLQRYGMGRVADFWSERTFSSHQWGILEQQYTRSLTEANVAKGMTAEVAQREAQTFFNARNVVTGRTDAGVTVNQLFEHNWLAPQQRDYAREYEFGGFNFNPEAMMALKGQFPSFAKSLGLDPDVSARMNPVTAAWRGRFRAYEAHRSLKAGSLTVPGGMHVMSPAQERAFGDIEEFGVKEGQVGTLEMLQEKLEGMGVDPKASGLIFPGLKNAVMDMPRNIRDTLFEEKGNLSGTSINTGISYLSAAATASKALRGDTGPVNAMQRMENVMESSGRIFDSKGGDIFKRIFGREVPQGFSMRYGYSRDLGAGELFVPNTGLEGIFRQAGASEESIAQTIQDLNAGKKTLYGAAMREPGQQYDPYAAFKTVTEGEFGRRGKPVPSRSGAAAPVGMFPLGDEDKDIAGGPLGFAVDKKGNIHVRAPKEVIAAQRQAASRNTYSPEAMGIADPRLWSATIPFTEVAQNWAAGKDPLAPKTKTGVHPMGEVLDTLARQGGNQRLKGQNYNPRKWMKSFMAMQGREQREINAVDTAMNEPYQGALDVRIQKNYPIMSWLGTLGLREQETRDAAGEVTKETYLSAITNPEMAGINPTEPGIWPSWRVDNTKGTLLNTMAGIATSPARLDIGEVNMSNRVLATGFTSTTAESDRLFAQLEQGKGGPESAKIIRNFTAQYENTPGYNYEAIPFVAMALNKVNAGARMNPEQAALLPKLAQQFPGLAEVLGLGAAAYEVFNPKGGNRPSLEYQRMMIEKQGVSPVGESAQAMLGDVMGGFKEIPGVSAGRNAPTAGPVGPGQGPSRPSIRRRAGEAGRSEEEIQKLRARVQTLSSSLGVRRYEAYKEEVESAPRRIAMDVRGLGAVNQALGEDVGTDMLQQFGQAAKAAGLDIYRYGGDDYVATWSGTREGAEAKVQELREKFASSVATGKSGAYTGFQMYAGISEPGESFEDAATRLVNPQKTEGYKALPKGTLSPSIRKLGVEPQRAEDLTNPASAPGHVELSNDDFGRFAQVSAQDIAKRKGADAVNAVASAIESETDPDRQGKLFAEIVKVNPAAAMQYASRRGQSKAGPPTGSRQPPQGPRPPTTGKRAGGPGRYRGRGGGGWAWGGSGREASEMEQVFESISGGIAGLPGEFARAMRKEPQWNDATAIAAVESFQETVLKSSKVGEQFGSLEQIPGLLGKGDWNEVFAMIGEEGGDVVGRKLKAVSPEAYEAIKATGGISKAARRAQGAAAHLVRQGLPNAGMSQDEYQTLQGMVGRNAATVVGGPADLMARADELLKAGVGGVEGKTRAAGPSSNDFYNQAMSAAAGKTKDMNEALEKYNKLAEQHKETTKEATEEMHKANVAAKENKEIRSAAELGRQLGIAGDYGGMGAHKGVAQGARGRAAALRTAAALLPEGADRDALEAEAGTIQAGAEELEGGMTDAGGARAIQKAGKSKLHQLGSAARGIFGGFGLMYMRNITGMMMGSLSRGYEEGMAYEEMSAQAMSGVYGGVAPRLSPQEQLSRANAMYGGGGRRAIDTARANFTRQNPGLVNTAGAALTGLEAFGATAWLMGELGPALGIGGPAGVAVAGIAGVTAFAANNVISYGGAYQDVRGSAIANAARMASGEAYNNQTPLLGKAAPGSDWAATVINKVFGGDTTKNVYYANKDIKRKADILDSMRAARDSGKNPDTALEQAGIPRSEWGQWEADFAQTRVEADTGTPTAGILGLAAFEQYTGAPIGQPVHDTRTGRVTQTGGARAIEMAIGAGIDVPGISKALATMGGLSTWNARGRMNETAIDLARNNLLGAADVEAISMGQQTIAASGRTAWATLPTNTAQARGLAQRVGRMNAWQGEAFAGGVGAGNAYRALGWGAPSLEDITAQTEGLGVEGARIYGLGNQQRMMAAQYGGAYQSSLLQNGMAPVQADTMVRQMQGQPMYAVQAATNVQGSQFNYNVAAASLGMGGRQFTNQTTANVEAGKMATNQSIAEALERNGWVEPGQGAAAVVRMNGGAVGLGGEAISPPGQGPQFQAPQPKYTQNINNLINAAANYDPTASLKLATYGIQNPAGMPGIGMWSDINLQGRATGQSWGTTSMQLGVPGGTVQEGPFAGMPTGYTAMQMGGKIWGGGFADSGANAGWLKGGTFTNVPGQGMVGRRQAMTQGISMGAEYGNRMLAGQQGAALFDAMQSYNFSMAGAGIAMEGWNINYAFTTGVGLDKYAGTVNPQTGEPFGFNTGKWNVNVPGAGKYTSQGGGIWGAEDAQRNLGYIQQKWQFGFQQRGINLQSQQFYQNMALQQEQVGMQRQWQKEDWAYQGQTRGLQWQWHEEDYSENVRFMSGRQRRLAQRQEGRDTTMHQLEGEQIDKQKSRQRDLWRLEDERFNVQKTQYEQNKAQQEEQLKMSKKFFEEQKKLQEEMVKLQRAEWVESMKNQKAQIGLQAAIAAAQLKNAEDNLALQDETTSLQSIWGSLNDLMGSDLDILIKKAKELQAALGGGGGGSPTVNHPRPTSTESPKLPDIDPNDPQPNFTTTTWGGAFITNGRKGNNETQTIVINVGNERFGKYIVDKVTREVSV